MDEEEKISILERTPYSHVVDEKSKRRVTMELLETRIVEPAWIKRKVVTVFGNFKICIYSKRSIILYLLVLIMYIAKTIYTYKNYPLMAKYECVMFVVFSISYLITIFKQVKYLYRNGSGIDLEPVNSDIKCVYCLTLHSESDYVHCYSCKCCVKGLKHHCGFIGVCLDTYKITFFALSIVLLVGLILITHIQCTSFYKAILINILKNLAPHIGEKIELDDKILDDHLSKIFTQAFGYQPDL